LDGYVAPSLLRHTKLSDKSIYWLLIEEYGNTCRICGSGRGSQERAIACARSDIGHRPFVCSGEEAGCLKCGPEPYIAHARFCSRTQLDDHIRNQTQKLKCIEWFVYAHCYWSASLNTFHFIVMLFIDAMG
ncbi:hypothetical protein CPB86DRAFT_390019, partial [Serendipita vermifera]